MSTSFVANLEPDVRALRLFQSGRPVTIHTLTLDPRDDSAWLDDEVPHSAALGP